MLFEIYFSLMEYFCENMGYLFSSFSSFSLFFFLLWTSFVSIVSYFCITHVSSYNNFWEKYYQELGAFILIKSNTFLSSPSVGAEHFEVDEKHVSSYFQYRSSTYTWRVRDLDIGNMIHLSTRVNKTWQNSTQSKQLMWKVFNETNIWLW